MPEVVNAPAKFMLVTSSVLPETIFNKDETVKIFPLFEGVSAIYVDGLGIERVLMDCTGTLVIEALALNCKVSEVEGVILLGNQLVETVKFVEVLPVQMNVFAYNAFVRNNNMMTIKKLFFILKQIKSY